MKKSWKISVEKGIAKNQIELRIGEPHQSAGQVSKSTQIAKSGKESGRTRRTLPERPMRLQRNFATGGRCRRFCASFFIVNFFRHWSFIRRGDRRGFQERAGGNFIFFNSQSVFSFSKERFRGRRRVVGKATSTNSFGPQFPGRKTVGSVDRQHRINSNFHRIGTFSKCAQNHCAAFADLSRFRCHCTHP